MTRKSHVRQVQELRRSNAAGKHRDKRLARMTKQLIIRLERKLSD